MKDRQMKAIFAAMAFIIIAFIGATAVMDADGDKPYGNTITVASSPDFPPYDHMSGDQFAGIELDIVRAVAMEMGVSVQFISVDFDSILAGVAGGTYMVGASGFTINDERKLSVDFSTPYTPEVKQVLLVKQTSGIFGIEDVKDMVVTAQSGTTGFYYADDYLKGENTVMPQQTYSLAVMAVLNGQADALVVDDLVAESFVNAYPNDLKVVTINDPNLEPELYGFIFAKGGSQLETDYNNALEKLIADGTVDNIYAYYAEHNYEPGTASYYSVHKPYGNVITVASSPDFPPYDHMSGDQFAGIELDIVRAIASKMGVSIQFISVDFDSILAGVASGTYMVGASGFTINDERKLSVDFTTPYTPQVKQVLLVKQDSGIMGIGDIVGKTVTAQSGTTGFYYADDYLKGENTITPQQTYSLAVMAVLNGQADALVVDDLVAESFVNAYPNDLKVVTIDDPRLTPELYGFIFAKGGSQLETDFNNALKELLADGTVDRIYEYYAKNNYEPGTASFYSSKSYGNVIYSAVSPDFPPYDHMSGDDYAGIELDIVKAIAKELGVSVEFISVDFDSILAGVSGGTYMMGSSGFTINDERKQSVDFSTPYTPEVRQVMVMLKTLDVDSYQDIKDMVITAQSGTTGYYYAADYLSDNNEVAPQQTYSFAVTAILTGKADVLIVDDLVGESFVQKYSNELKIVSIDDPRLVPELYGFIFAKGGSDLENDVNAALEKLLKNGIVDNIYAYYAEHNYEPGTPSYFNQGGDDPDEPVGDSWWDQLVNSFVKSFITKDRYKTVIQGFINTIEITLVALVIGLGIGALAGAVRTLHDTTGRWKIANAICKLYITIIRGTPVMIQLLIIYFVIFASSDLNAIIIASVAFGLNSGAYVAEIIRAGINAVPKGQMEACESLGMSYKMSMTSVIMPQAIRNILPALCNEGISLLKETSIAGYIGVIDLTFAAKLIVGQTYEPFMPYIVVAIIYLAVVLVLQYLVGRLERRLNNAY